MNNYTFVAFRVPRGDDDAATIDTALRLWARSFGDKSVVASMPMLRDAPQMLTIADLVRLDDITMPSGDKLLEFA